MSFVVPAFVLAVGWVAALRRSSPLRSLGRLGRWWPLAVWTVGVWVVRIADIAFAGDHAIGFVAVHVRARSGVLGLALWAVSAATPGARARTDISGDCQSSEHGMSHR